MVQSCGGVLLPQADGIQLLLIQARQASGGSSDQGTESKAVHPNWLPNPPSKQRKSPITFACQGNRYQLQNTPLSVDKRFLSV